MDSLTIFEDTHLGLLPYYFAEAGQAHADTIAKLFASDAPLTRQADPEGLRQTFARQPDDRRTCFSGVSKVPLNGTLRHHSSSFSIAERTHREPSRRSLLAVLEEATHRILASSHRPALALSGGLDSALLLAMCRRCQPDLTIVTLATDLPGYCEREITLATANALDAKDVLIIEAGADDFVSALPAAITACETPLYNLHPVSKWLVARTLQQRGFDTIITGDGADQVFAGSDPRNYLPIVGAMTRATGITLASPFLDPMVIDSAILFGVDPQKTALREAAAELIPHEIAERPKQPRLAPDFDLAHFRSAEADAAISRILRASPPPSSAGPENTLWATATLLYQALGGLG